MVAVDKAVVRVSGREPQPTVEATNCSAPKVQVKHQSTTGCVASLLTHGYRHQLLRSYSSLILMARNDPFIEWKMPISSGLSEA